MSTYQELKAQIVALQEQVEAARVSERYTMLAQIREAVATFQFTEGEIFGRPASRKRVVFAKYRNPETGETWSGRGRAPTWINGKNRERFLIQD